MTAVTDLEWRTRIGPVDTGVGNEILRCLVGSTSHGLALEGTDDRDWMAIYVPPPEQLYGVSAVRDSVVLRTQPEGTRSGHGDVDYVLYSLRKYARLAAAGNPTVLIPLFVQGDAVLHQTSQGEALRAGKGLLVSQVAGRRFLGYLDAQYERLMGGGKQNRLPNRPELITAHGWDTKYAMHALRLGLQGVELMRTGTLTLPMKKDSVHRLMAVRRGHVGKDTAVSWIVETRAKLAELVEQHPGNCPLPAAPNLTAVDRMVVAIHEAHWASV